MLPPRSYVICTSPRSGSTLLCSLLKETRIAGSPDSHFHAASLGKWLEAYGLPIPDFSNDRDALEAVFKSALVLGKGTSDIFALRMQRHSFTFFTEQLRVLFPDLPDDISRISAAFGRTMFIHLTRENKLDQAISYVRATQSGLWHMAPDGTELERLSEPVDPVYDPIAIADQLALSLKMDREWEAWFDHQKITPLRVTYSELSAAPYATLARVLKKLGLRFEPNEQATPPVAKLADSTNREWARRFQSDLRT